MASHGRKSAESSEPDSDPRLSVQICRLSWLRKLGERRRRGWTYGWGDVAAGGHVAILGGPDVAMPGPSRVKVTGAV